ncbi:GAF domain-containing protein [Legionella sp. MW5194]|uniref:GAF domain-containing sensor histidine kinase n=1 Tax=Legionella sp. MW5194 TaxID=2662448 RepID=UPI00193CA538|nr:GAF domain-containing sensor histidine kinase [Legionella sp. MW5194]QRN04725.1 GAF domain-containing protein [Legionella sp. MW5194]
MDEYVVKKITQTPDHFAADEQPSSPSPDKDYLTVLHKISLRLRNRHALSSLLQTLNRAFVKFARADKGNIQLYDPLSHMLHTVSSHGFNKEMRQSLPLLNEEQSPCRMAAMDAKTIHVDLINDSAFDHPCPAMAWLMKSGICSMMTIPIIAYGRLLGVIALYWKRHCYPDRKVLTILDLLAHETANLIQHRQHEEILQAQKIKAEESSHAKDLFLATLSHELRSPLTAILTWAQLLKSQHISKEKLAIGLNAIEDSAMTQNTIINDLMDISGTILGKITLDMQPADLSQLIRLCVDSIRASAEKKSVSLRMCCSKPLIVSCDQTRIKQVFSNLLANAIKFTPEGGEITIQSQSHIHPNQRFAEIVVSDNGKGIKAEFLSSIFMLFNQGFIKQREGFGLGLALANNLIKLHGGTIKAHSEGENKGASFTIQLPLL